MQDNSCFIKFIDINSPQNVPSYSFDVSSSSAMLSSVAIKNHLQFGTTPLPLLTKLQHLNALLKLRLLVSGDTSQIIHAIATLFAPFNSPSFYKTRESVLCHTSR